MKANYFLLIVGILLGLTPTFAQPSFTTSDKEGAKIVKESILAVVVKDKDEKAVKKLSKKPEQLRAYETSIEKFNSLLKQAIQNEWHFSKNVQFISQTEAEKLKDDRNANYCILEAVEETNYKMGDFYSAGSHGGFTSPRDLAYHLSPSGGSIALEIVHGASSKKEIVRSYLPVLGISPGTMTFMVQHLSNQLTDCLEKDITKLSKLKDDIEARAPQLKKKTLLLVEPLMSKGLKSTLEKGKLKEFYGYPCEVISSEKFDAIIASKSADYAYIWVVPAGAINGGQVICNYFIVDATDGRALYLTGKAVAGANGEFHQAQLAMVNKELK